MLYFFLEIFIMNPTNCITTIAIAILIGNQCLDAQQTPDSEITGGTELPDDVELLTGRDGLPTGKLAMPFHHQPTIYSPYGPSSSGLALQPHPQIVRPITSSSLNSVILMEFSRMMRLMGFRGISRYIRNMLQDDEHHALLPISASPESTGILLVDRPSFPSYTQTQIIQNYTSYAPPPSGIVSSSLQRRESRSLTHNNLEILMGFGKMMNTISFNNGMRKYLRFMMQHAAGPAFRATAILFGDNAEAGPMGNILFTQFTLNDPVMVTINATGLPAGKHAIHVHAYGDLREGCKSTGPHVQNILVRST